MSKKPLSFKGFKPASETSSRIKSKTRSSNTKHELIIRSLLWRMGFRFRKNVKNLPGKPDIVFTKSRVIIFCDGDFWHGKNWEERKQKITKGSNAPYWLSKIESNIDRDKRHNKELELLN